ncbi:MAG: Gfo/Idh/MocA family oxidoreductase [Phycisphaeraceae bacterium]
MAKQVKYAVVACGAIAQRRHLPEAAANPRSKVVAVADIREDRVREVAGKYGCPGYTDHKRMLKEVDCDAVVVCGPNKYHAPQTLDAFKAGKHVLVEKPMATTRADAKKMIAASKKARKHLMIGLNQRLSPPHVKAREILDGGKLGKVLSFRTAFAHAGPDSWSLDGANSWFFDPELAVMGATGDLGVHKADLMRYLLNDEFTHVGGIVETRDKKDGRGKLIGLDDNAYLTLRTKKGAVGYIVASWTNYGQSEGNYTAIYCENGVMELAMDPDFGVVVKYSNGNVEKHKVGAVASNERQTSSGVIDTFTDCILKNRKPEIDGIEGYRCLNVILTAMDASKRAKVLPLKD